MVGQRMKPQENVSFRLKTLCLGQKNSEKNICFPLKKLFFLPSVEKTTIFSSGNKSSPQSFSVPGIMFPPRRNIYSPQFANFLMTSQKLFISSFHFPIMNVIEARIRIGKIPHVSRVAFFHPHPHFSLKNQTHF